MPSVGRSPAISPMNVNSASGGTMARLVEAVDGRVLRYVPASAFVFISAVWKYGSVGELVNLASFEILINPVTELY